MLTTRLLLKLIQHQLKKELQLKMEQKLKKPKHQHHKTQKTHTRKKLIH